MPIKILVESTWVEINTNSVVYLLAAKRAYSISHLIFTVIAENLVLAWQKHAIYFLNVTYFAHGLMWFERKKSLGHVERHTWSVLELVSYVTKHTHSSILSFLVISNFLFSRITLLLIVLNPVAMLILQWVQLIDSFLAVHCWTALLNQVVDLYLIKP